MKAGAAMAVRSIDPILTASPPEDGKCVTFGEGKTTGRHLASEGVEGGENGYIVGRCSAAADCVSTGGPSGVESARSASCCLKRHRSIEAVCIAAALLFEWAVFTVNPVALLPTDMEGADVMF
jgi:hypothetical protein